MGMAAILVMWPGPLEQAFIPASQGVSIWNLSLIDPMVSEEMFENVDGRRSDWYTILRRKSLVSIYVSHKINITGYIIVKLYTWVVLS